MSKIRLQLILFCFVFSSSEKWRLLIIQMSSDERDEDGWF